MSDKSFEQSVREKMDELSFHPSDKVWSGVEAELDGGRRKRRMLLWIPAAAAILVAVLLTGNFGLLKHDKVLSGLDKKGTNKTNIKSREGAPASIAPGAGSQQQQASTSTGEVAENDAVKPGEGSSINEVQENDAVKPGEGSTVNKVQENIIAEKGIASERSENKDHSYAQQERKEARENLFLSMKVSGEKAMQGNDKLNSQTNAEHPLEEKLAWEINASHPLKSRLALVPVERNSMAEGLKNTPAYDQIKIAGSLKNERAASIAAAKKMNKAQKKWRYYASTSSGISGVNDGGLLDMRTAMADYSRFSPSLNYSGGNVIGNNYGSPMLAPVSPGVFINVSGGVDHFIASKWSIGTGLGYSGFSTSMKNVGWDKRTINMHYGLIELPLTIGFHPRSFSAHMGLISSAIVQYNVKQPGSYAVATTDAGDLHRMQFGVIAGADFGLIKKYKDQLKIGPVFRYQFTDLGSKSITEQHLASGSVRIKWYLNQ